jgi:glycosyltransferase involved in cell wall biosynthesis
MKSKTFFVNFGNDKLYQNLVAHSPDVNFLKRKWLKKEQLNKCCISIGYNNRNAQQHIKVIEELSKLNTNFKNNLLLILPLTYPKDNLYKKKIKTELDRKSLPYFIIDRYVSEKEIIELRLISDIYINMQITDMFSTSVLEYMALDTITINGDWLPYSYIQDEGIYAHTANWDNLANVTSTVIQNLKNEKNKLTSNREKIRDLIDWNLLIPRWAEYLNIDTNLKHRQS